MISLRVKSINKTLSFLLLFAMIVTLFPAGAFAETDTDMDMGLKGITSFEPITMNAGAAGSATYAGASAVIAYLNANYASVTAQVYGGDTVSVPATSWTDTDAYNPSTAGSYTFTATLGEIPAGYTNPDNLTAAAEVVVAESAGMGKGAGTGEAGGTAPQDARAVLTAEGGSLADGLYDIPASFQLAQGYPSANLNSMLASAELEVTGGVIKVILNVVEGVTVSGPDYIKKLQFESVYGSGAYAYATIEATDDSGKPSKFSFTIPEERQYTGVKLERKSLTSSAYLYLDFASATLQEPPDTVDKTALAAELDEARAIEQGSYTQESYAALQQAITAGEVVLADEDATQGEVDEAALLLHSAISALEEEQVDIEITGFDAITVDAGVAGSATYADATAVIAYLNANHASVTAQVYGGDTVSVPATSWADTDAYDPSTAGSYTFTATLGEIPAGYANPGSLTATAEVTVVQPDSMPVTINDENLKKVIRWRLNKPQNYIITVGDMKRLDTFYSLAMNQNITDLTGLEAAVNLTNLNLSGNSVSVFPDLSGTALKTLVLSENGLTDIPANVLKLTRLENLDLNNNPLSAVTADLFPLSRLKTLNLSNCSLRELPESIFELSTLEYLDLSLNKLRSVSGSIAELPNLKELNLGANRLDEFPAGVKYLNSLLRLYISGNYYTDLPADLADYLPNLTWFEYGGYIRYGSSLTYPDPESNAAAVKAALQSRNPAVYVYLGQAPRFSSLRELEWDFGEISQINDSAVPAEIQEYTLTVPEGTTDVNFSLTAMLDDTTITVNGTPVANKSSIEVPLAGSVTSVEIVCYNPYAPSFIFSKGNTTTYKLTIVGGSQSGGDFPAEGREYSIGIRVWHQSQEQYSMADAYFLHTAKMTYGQGQFAVYVTVAKDSWIPEMSYRNAAGDYVAAELISRNTEADTAVYRLYVEEDALDEALYISPFVGPMGYAPICRIIFDPASIVDITAAVNKTALAAELDEARAIEQGSYTQESYAALQQAITAGEVVLADEDATQGEVDEAALLLHSAISALEEEQADIEITSFDPIGIPAGTAGSATYADAAAVIAYLNASYASVTARVYGGGTVTVPVASWADTDAYNPVVVGSYTFTATLGEIPAGYANPSNLTATAEVVVEEVPDTIADGEYTIPVSLWQASNNQASMGNNALEQTARLVVEDGEGTLYLQFKSLTIEAWNMTGYLANLKLATNVQFNELGGIDSADLTDAAVISSYDGVWDVYNHPDTGTDPHVKGKAYPKVVSIPVELEAEYTYVQVYVPVMEAISGGTGGGTQYARVKLDWSGLTAVGQPNPDDEPVQEINDDDNDGAVEFTQDDLSGLSDTDNVGLSAGGANINIPAQYLNEMFAGSQGAGLKFEAKESPADTKTAVFQLLGNNDELAGAFDLNLKIGDQAITDLGGRVKITLSLTDAQVTALQNAETRKLCYYNPATGELEDMDATFDLANKTVTFYTDHLSTYAIITTKADSAGGAPPNSHGLANGTYSINVDALQEYSNSPSMADQFFTEPAELNVSGETIIVIVVMYGTASSPELTTGIRMSYINSLQYKNASGNWVNAIDSRNEAQDSIKVKMTVSSLNDVYMRVQTDYMGPDYKVFRLVFDRTSLKQGGVIPSGGATSTTYTIKATAGEGGSISPSGDVSVKKGENQSFAITPAAGYKIKEVLVDGKSVGAVSTYTFKAVTQDGSIRAVFEKTGETPPPVPAPAASSKFTDISGHWAEAAIDFVVSRGMFVGTSETLFSPDSFIARGMFVTVLGRISQVDPAAQAAPQFADVDPEAYYTPYIAWAAAKDIVRGVGDGRFEPDREITREEMAVIFVKYARLAGIELDTTTTTTTPTEPAPEGALEDGRYTIEASALMENKDDASMADQFLTEPATLTVAGGRITAAMTWHGTEYVTMDMLEELKILKSTGELVDVARIFDQEQNTLAVTFEVEDLEQATVMQVYVPRGMGEIRPKFRLVFDTASLKEQASPIAGLEGRQQASTFADATEISDWARESVETMSAAGIIKGRDNNTFDPRGLTTRAEAAMILARSVGFSG